MPKNKESENLHDFSTMQIIQLMNEQDKKVAAVVEDALPEVEKAINLMVHTIENEGRILYFGAGTSGRLGVLDASECPPTFGVSPDLVQGFIAGGDIALRNAIENAEDNFETGRFEVKANAKERDVIVGIASSGSTPYVLGAINQANQMNLSTIGISCNVNTKLSACVDVAIELPVGAEIITGSTRLKAGTAQKMVLNMLSTATMIRTGKIYKNLMVNVQATNEKLRKRAIGIIMDITNVDEAKAIEANDKANGDVRVAILIILFDLKPKQALAILMKHKGNFVNAMKELTRNTP